MEPLGAGRREIRGRTYIVCTPAARPVVWARPCSISWLLGLGQWRERLTMIMPVRVLLRRSRDIDAPTRRRRARRCAAAAAALLVIGGCGGSEFRTEPDRARAPSARRLREVRSGSPGAYWLGGAFGSRKLSGVEWFRGGSAGFTYGEPRCDPGSGCSYDISVGTSLRRDLVDVGQPTCWRHVGPAWMLGCLNAGYALEEFDVLTGTVRVDVAVTVDRLSRLEIVRALRSVGSSARLSAPRRFSCAESRRLSKRLRGSIPAELRSRCP